MKKLLLLILLLPLLTAGIRYKDYYIPLEEQEPIVTVPSCLVGKFTGATGQLKAHHINIINNGRLALGDVNNDSHKDIIVSRRNKITAYDVCGKVLWTKAARPAWDIRPVGSGNSENAHPYFNWSSLGWLDDIDKDGAKEFMYISSNFRTLYILTASNGNYEAQIDLGPGRWLYVAAGRALGDTGEQASQIFAMQEPGMLRVKSFKKVGGTTSLRWSKDYGFVQNRYASPVVKDINGDNIDDVVHSSIAFNGTGGNFFWGYNFTNFTPLGTHTINIADVNPAVPGLETIYSLYGPKKGLASILIVDKFGRIKQNNVGGTHPHQHTIGNFALNSSGDEIIARHNNGKDHWMIDGKTGNTIRTKFRLNPRNLRNDWGMDWGNEGGEIVHGIEWDEKLGTELLYVERHVNFRNVPKNIIHDLNQNRFVTRIFGGGIDVPKRDSTSGLGYENRNSWYGWISRANGQSVQDGPYEGDPHVIDFFGDGREDVVTQAQNKIVIYYNSGDAKVEPRRDDFKYWRSKQKWTSVYSPK